ASDPVDELLRRDAFQRRAVELGRASGHAVAGRVGDHGVVFLSGSGGSATSQKRKVRELAEKALSLGKRLGLALHFGSSAAPASLPMAQSYHAALGAAESALAHGAELVAAKLEARRSAPSLQSLRRELGVAVEERPELFSARFERYLDAVAVECAYRVEPARVHLEIGFERVTEALADSGVLDAKSLRVMSEELSRTTRGSLDISDLFAAYRRAVFDVSQAAREPAPAHRDRNLRGAIEYMQQHYAETLGRDQVARIAGFAPGYFSELFKEREGVSFEQYLSGLRIERAKQLLHGTDLDAKRVAKLSGFKSPDYFAHAFRRATGITPLAFRRSHRTVPRAPGSPGRLSD
ncbi:MAG TPA: AraC family transcriptional regulator, partial [Polyangiaceae bacterium]|nr:AraC family transcriptional regulator [Polyangiaceae bacterium]